MDCLEGTLVYYRGGVFACCVQILAQRSYSFLEYFYQSGRTHGGAHSLPRTLSRAAPAPSPPREAKRARKYNQSPSQVLPVVHAYGRGARFETGVVRGSHTAMPCRDMRGRSPAPAPPLSSGRPSKRSPQERRCSDALRYSRCGPTLCCGIRPAHA